MLHRISLILLYTITAVVIVIMILYGGNYYTLPLVERPFHSDYANLKPGGFVSHGLGIIGSLMILTLLLYSFRKRMRYMHGKGDIRYWLNYHIWLGITGPILIVFHSTFKVGGIIAVSFWSMVAVALSGVLGRYIYVQIPRSKSGEELSAEEIESAESGMMNELKQFGSDSDDVKKVVQDTLAGLTVERHESWVKLIYAWMLSDLEIFVRMNRFKSDLRKAAVTPVQLNALSKAMHKLLKLRRKRIALSRAKAMLHYWHIVHKPFAIVMIIIMFVHVTVAVMFGYTWIF